MKRVIALISLVIIFSVVFAYQHFSNETVYTSTDSIHENVVTDQLTGDSLTDLLTICSRTLTSKYTMSSYEVEDNHVSFSFEQSLNDNDIAYIEAMFVTNFNALNVKDFYSEVIVRIKHSDGTVEFIIK